MEDMCGKSILQSEQLEIPTTVAFATVASECMMVLE